ncbi:MAG: HepT-like ribonuclease domain-containing protein [Tissierellaceae bacterium]
MKNRTRDINIITKIMNYCEEIFATQKYFGSDYNIFKENFIYKNAISMSILQIGELSGHLSEDFKDTHYKIPWRNIRGIRNFMAHEYGNLDTSLVWDTVLEDIPKLYKYCVELTGMEREEISDEWKPE